MVHSIISKYENLFSFSFNMNKEILTIQYFRVRTILACQFQQKLILFVTPGLSSYPLIWYFSVRNSHFRAMSGFNWYSARQASDEQNNEIVQFFGKCVLKKPSFNQLYLAKLVQFVTLGPAADLSSNLVTATHFQMGKTRSASSCKY